jgi:anti-sigma-K factor RskA
MKNLSKDRLFELLADQTISGLSAEELVELEKLKTQFPEWEKDFSFELTAAAIGLLNIDVSDDLPANLRAKIVANADEFFYPQEELQNVVNFTPRTEKITGSMATETVSNITESTPNRPFWQWLGWAFAAAACVALAVNLWTTRSRPQTEIVQKPPIVQSPTPKLSVEQERTQLLAAASDTVKIPLADAKNAKEILGEMVWSNSLQKGYASFRNLPANDIAKESYQLWIVDETQNLKTPISGGVFNISATGEVIIPIDPQLTVKKPVMIAITKEKPGGVVVSSPERIVALAKI